MTPSGRPVAVTAACALAGLAAVLTTVLLLTTAPWAVAPTAAQRGVGLAAVGATLAAVAGMWQMRRWGVALMAVLLAARVVYSLARPGTWNLPGLVGPVLLLLIGVAYWRRMA